MDSILIAYNNDMNEKLHNFYTDCADAIKQCCITYSLHYDELCPPILTNEKVRSLIGRNKICMVAAHGLPDSIVNENDDEIVSIRTTNYDFKDKAFFAISCDCGQLLMEELIRLELKVFVGYKAKLMIYEAYPEFLECVISGLKIFLSGVDVQTMTQYIINEYDRCIDATDSNPIVSHALLDNREALVVKGEPKLTILSLK